MRNEARFRVIERTNPARFRAFVKEAQKEAEQRFAVYQQMANITVPQIEPAADDQPAAPISESED